MKTRKVLKYQPRVRAILAALAVWGVACNGTGEGLSSVTGKVMCNGQPAAGAVLVLHRQAGTEAPPAAHRP